MSNSMFLLYRKITLYQRVWRHSSSFDCDDFIGNIPTKRRVRQESCECGLSSKSFSMNGTLNSAMYLDECIHKRLEHFIAQVDSPAIFWEDLAPIHHSSAAPENFEANDILIDPTDHNHVAVRKSVK